MTKNRGIRYISRLIIFAAGMAVLPTGCHSIDLTTEEGLTEALNKRENLNKAIPKISNMITKPDELKKYVDPLVNLYLDEKENSFDREIIQALAVVNDSKIIPALKRAAKSPDPKQVMEAARGAKLVGDPEVIATLNGMYKDQTNPEIQRVILEIGTSVKSSELSKLAQNVLSGEVDKTPFNLLRASCDVLAFQQDTAAVELLMNVVYHQDGVGRSLSTNCTRALLALPKDIVAPVLLKAFKLENEKLMEYVEKHPDTLTPESIRNNTVNALALYRYQEAIDPILDYVENTRTIPVPGTLAIRPAADPAWQMWASLVGVAAQSCLFALTDIGIKDNQRAKKILMDVFHWTTPYKSKFKNAIELTGTTNIEVSQRVNAFRALKENGLLTNDEVMQMIESLKGEEFMDEKKWRPFARASIATDMITYCAVTSNPGDTQTIWKAFNDMKANEFKVPVPEDPEAPKVQHWNDSISQRIDDVKSTFELAEKCNYNNAQGCVDYLKDKGENITGYELAKIMYEVGLSGDRKFFDFVKENYKRLDVFGQLYGTKALANLGTRDNVKDIEEMLTTLAKDMNQIQFIAAKPNLEGLITTLRSK